MIDTFVRRCWWPALGLVLLALLAPQPATPAQIQQLPQPKVQPKVLPKADPGGSTKLTPRLEPVAETRLIMEGLAHANFRGLERLLTERPAELKAWQFARGQALLLAETGNMLMLRPPKNQGQPAWFEKAMALRAAAKELGESVGQRDFDASKTGLLKVAAVCNSCHQTFRVNVEIAPFTQPAVQKASLK